MKWRWLFNQYLDPGLGLDLMQRARVREIVRERLRARIPLVTLAAVLPFLALITVGSPVARWFALRAGVPSMAATLLFLAAVLAFVWPWSAWVKGRFYTRPYRRAVREIGVPVCEWCGYLLRGLPQDSPCPECGRAPSPAPAPPPRA